MREILEGIFTWSRLSEPHGYDFNGYFVRHEGGNLVVDRQHDRYQLDPAHYLEADKLARQLGLDIVGVWHTHPDHPPIPSVTDREHAWQGFVYWIVPTTKDGAGDGRWWILGGEANEGFLEVEAVSSDDQN